MAVQKRPIPGPTPAANIGAFPVLDASPSAILGVDGYGRIVYANARVEQTFGWPPAELLGATVERLIPNHLAKRHVAHRAAFAANPIVRQGGGHIWLYSEPGRGTTFKCYFPRAEAAPADVDETPVDEPGLASRTILLVEDEPTVRQLSRRVLERAGYAVIAPSDPREALLLAESRATAVDALVTDVVMPDVSGPELARRMLAVRPGTPLVLLSGYSQETADVDDLVQQGAVFASKPLGTRDLLALVDRALRGRTLNPSGGG